MNELKNNYPDLDYAALTTNSEDYGRIKAAIAEAKTGKVKLKVVG